MYGLGHDRKLIFVIRVHYWGKREFISPRLHCYTTFWNSSLHRVNTSAESYISNILKTRRIVDPQAMKSLIYNVNALQCCWRNPATLSSPLQSVCNAIGDGKHWDLPTGIRCRQEVTCSGFVNPCWFRDPMKFWTGKRALRWKVRRGIYFSRCRI